MSRQLGSLHRSNSHPTNLTSPIPITPLFAFPPPDFPSSNVTSGMIPTLIHTSQFYIPSHNSITRILKPPMNLPTQNHPHPIIFITLLIFLNPLFNPYYPITLTQSLPHPLMLPKLPQPTPHTILTNHLILQTPPESPQS